MKLDDRSNSTCGKRAGKKQRIPKNPKHPERICWGCERLCAANKMFCGNGSERSQHPCELFGEDWYLSLTEEELAYIELV
ncbi:hypothetical protein GCM10007161_06470 [Ignatzschineria indica]|uniref:DUF3079 domain-containing protein n=1 Tax=Ignatzschineria indica TaxID=472583 RepID=A0A2U2AN30_9GAMM|nr:DUF3079 domain-containing protein [Ignatzschineria indica]PWD84619.1 hypothetical protein DC082_03550 [Ignatzschineria indica]GGZ77865.1 hypothetical protein GCM10007161_06470 [Ignatzschineria indica]